MARSRLKHSPLDPASDIILVFSEPSEEMKESFWRLAQCELLTINLIRMSKRCGIQKEYYKQYGNYKGNGKYSDKYVRWLENEVLALRQPLVMRSFTACPSCGSDKIYFEGWWTCHECTHDWGGK